MSRDAHFSVPSACCKYGSFRPYQQGEVIQFLARVCAIGLDRITEFSGLTSARNEFTSHDRGRELSRQRVSEAAHFFYRNRIKLFKLKITLTHNCLETSYGHLIESAFRFAKPRGSVCFKIGTPAY